jgi:hypothetical protein
MRLERRMGLSVLLLHRRRYRGPTRVRRGETCGMDQKTHHDLGPTIRAGRPRAIITVEHVPGCLLSFSDEPPDTGNMVLVDRSSIQSAPERRYQRGERIGHLYSYGVCDSIRWHVWLAPRFKDIAWRTCGHLRDWFNTKAVYETHREVGGRILT